MAVRGRGGRNSFRSLDMRVSVKGLPELQRSLREIDRTAPRELRKVNLEAARLVANSARARARSLGGVAAKVAPSVKASAQQRAAGVSIGNDSYPMALGAEFGAGQETRRSRRNGTYVGYRQFKPWRGNDRDAGYFLYPTIRDRMVDVIEIYTEGIGDILDRHFRE